MTLVTATGAHAPALLEGRTIRDFDYGNRDYGRPILSTNEMLGFVKQPAWASLMKHLKQD